MNKYFSKETGKFYYSEEYAKRRDWHKNNTLDRYHTGKGLSGKKVRTKEEWQKSNRKWQKENKEKFRKYQLEYYKKKRNEDPNFRMLHNLRTRMTLGLKADNISKHNTMIKLIGCSFDELKKYLENNFLDGMSWENYGRGGWHIDHIQPCCSFDLTKIENQMKCFHYSNLRPLWAKENFMKASLDRKVTK